MSIHAAGTGREGQEYQPERARNVEFSNTEPVGHGYIGEYYVQFIPSKDVDCPVHPWHQGRDNSSDQALIEFIENTGAFTLSGESRGERRAPEPKEEERWEE
ncbi:uncharacterized protein EV420DRAFT_1488944 [Desarmillaria tabescens]|uniref:Uncharacterized protein n=1 Tax=Armillaria tabescens TaxID=1929756 RepID=A0AA39J0G5_ARMTA|nr:uncharacterized protein EV420DRAFT_1488944 [Desarmillaria tabescens]KAK0433823.1 hypothetical protein EV420DRAFT_1488944 [Desarmillaria tabescens]